MTLGVDAQVTPNGSKVSLMSRFCPFFESLGIDPPESLLRLLVRHFHCLGVLGSLAGTTDHKTCLAVFSRFLSSHNLLNPACPRNTTG